MPEDVVDRQRAVRVGVVRTLVVSVLMLACLVGTFGFGTGRSVVAGVAGAVVGLSGVVVLSKLRTPLPRARVELLGRVFASVNVLAYVAIIVVVAATSLSGGLAAG